MPVMETGAVQIVDTPGGLRPPTTVSLDAANFVTSFGVTVIGAFMLWMVFVTFFRGLMDGMVMGEGTLMLAVGKDVRTDVTTDFTAESKAALLGSCNVETVSDTVRYKAVFPLFGDDETCRMMLAIDTDGCWGLDSWGEIFPGTGLQLGWGKPGDGKGDLFPEVSSTDLRASNKVFTVTLFAYLHICFPGDVAEMYPGEFTDSTEILGVDFVAIVTALVVGSITTDICLVWGETRSVPVVSVEVVGTDESLVLTSNGANLSVNGCVIPWLTTEAFCTTMDL